MERVQKMEVICAEYEVQLPAVAMQFIIAHPAVPSFLAGTRTVQQLQQNLHWFNQKIPDQLWIDLKATGLIHEDAPTP